jgi:hypothetical protein
VRPPTPCVITCLHAMCDHPMSHVKHATSHAICPMQAGPELQVQSMEHVTQRMIHAFPWAPAAGGGGGGRREEGGGGCSRRFAGCQRCGSAVRCTLKVGRHSVQQQPAGTQAHIMLHSSLTYPVCMIALHSNPQVSTWPYPYAVVAAPPWTPPPPPSPSNTW